MKIGIIGCSGRMGKTITQQVTQLDRCTISAGMVRPQTSEVGMDIGTMAQLASLGVTATDHITPALLESEAIIDFSAPETTLSILTALTKANKKPVYVIGTTGFNQQQTNQIEEFATKLPIIWSANMSIGVNLLLGLTEQVATILDTHYDIEIIEAHHKHKVDAPSGTALALGRAAANGRKVALNAVACKSRDGIIGPRPTGEIGFATIRAADIIGEHTVMFATEGERIELTHKASDRSIFAKGAIRAAIWGYNNQLTTGLYSMKDVLFGNE